MTVIDDIKKDADGRMDKSVAALGKALTKLRTGRAHTSLLDHITVDYYGTQDSIKTKTRPFHEVNNNELTVNGLQN